MADEVASHNQLAFGVRFLDGENNIREEFLKFSSLTTITGEYVAQEIQRSSEGFSIPIQDMRGQGYGGTSNMSPDKDGVQARIWEHALLASYVHCSGHCPESGHQPLMCPSWST